MNTFIINLSERNDRKKFMLDQLNNLKLDYQFIEAIDGRKLSGDEINKVALNFKDSYLTKGEIGCALSHLKVYKKIIDEKIDIALILEDDAILPSNIETIINEIKAIDNNQKPNIYLLSNAKKFIKNEKLSNNIYRIKDASAAHAYIINAKAAKNLISKLYPIRYEADMWSIFNFFGFAKIYCIHPNPIKAAGHAEFSSLENERIHMQKNRNLYRDRLKKKEPYYHLFKLKNSILKKLQIISKSNQEY
ncbi:glycosyltransferase family 25 protein [Providencia sneebia]|uniref:Beta1,4-galactosyltransferase n=1 Tax=Providencia sneebia DSM 19967 TaxID=1141660 RepID=K8WII3_9GAMM|nr:glycosyltransferase family 25 protein [Providencia sneebia]EKT57307.1 beta1,4-galactosyltransferase [Providencia sneebia DSM 19967]